MQGSNKYSLSIAILLLIIGFSNCGTTNEPELSIEILSPRDGETWYLDSLTMHKLDIQFTSAEKLAIKNVILKVDTAILMNIKVVDQEESSMRWQQQLYLEDYAYPKGTAYTVDVKACIDEACEKSTNAQSSFTVK